MLKQRSVCICETCGHMAVYTGEGSGCSCCTCPKEYVIELDKKLADKIEIVHVPTNKVIRTLSVGDLSPIIKQRMWNGVEVNIDPSLYALRWGI